MKTKQLKSPLTPIQRVWIGRFPLSALTVVCAALTSCGSLSPPPAPPVGQALIDATPGKEDQDRIKGMRITSINGVSRSGDEAVLGTGLNVVTVRYNWPQGGTQEVNLKFKALPNRSYRVKTDPFPPTLNQFRGTTEVSNAAAALHHKAFDLMGNHGSAPLGALVLPPAIVLGAADYAYRCKESVRENRSAAQYVDVMVISEKLDEGVVRWVRAYPSGHVETNRWERFSNTYGDASRSGTSMHYDQHAPIELE